MLQGSGECWLSKDAQFNAHLSIVLYGCKTYLLAGGFIYHKQPLVCLAPQALLQQPLPFQPMGLYEDAFHGIRPRATPLTFPSLFELLHKAEDSSDWNHCCT